MAAIFSFRCSSCGELHEGSPSFGFRAPYQYDSLSEEEKAQWGTLSDDFCTITRDEETDFFIRAILEIPIHGVEQPFLWGLWVSLSEKSFDRYEETYSEPVAGKRFFGWVCNKIALYPCDHSRASDVVVQSGRSRPKLLLHRSDHEDDPLVIDQVQGISVARAQELAQRALHGA